MHVLLLIVLWAFAICIGIMVMGLVVAVCFLLLFLATGYPFDWVPFWHRSRRATVGRHKRWW